MYEIQGLNFLYTGCRRLKNTTELDHPDIFFIKLDIFWKIFGNCLEILEHFWEVLGLFWGHFGTFLEHFGTFLEHFWNILYSVEYFFYDVYTVYSTFSIIFQGHFFPIKKYFGPVIFFNRYIF